MQISVSFRNVDPSDHLKSYAETRMARFKKYMEEPVEIHLVLSIQKFRHTADVTISANGVKIKAQEETGDLYSAIDMVLDKIEKQIKRHREKIKEHKAEWKDQGSAGSEEKPGRRRARGRGFSPDCEDRKYLGQTYGCGRSLFATETVER